MVDLALLEKLKLDCSWSDDDHDWTVTDGRVSANALTLCAAIELYVAETAKRDAN